MTNNVQISDREREILQLVAQGATNQQIADQLNISVNTVKVHLRNIFGKIGVVSRTEATLYAIRNGIVSVAERAGAPDEAASLNRVSADETGLAAPAPADVAEPEAATLLAPETAPGLLAAPSPAASASPARSGLQRLWWSGAVLVGLVLAGALIAGWLIWRLPPLQPNRAPLWQPVAPRRQPRSAGSPMRRFPRRGRISP